MKAKLKYRLISAVSLVAGFLPGPVMAQVSAGKPPLELRTDFIGYALSASPQVTYTDNVLLDSGTNPQEDAIASLILNGGVFVNRPHFTGLVSGDVRFGGYLNPATDNAGVEQYDQFRVDKNVTGAGTIKFIDNLLFLDLGLAAQQQALGQNAAIADRQGAANEQRAEALSYSVSPYLYSKFSNEGSAEARYRFTRVTVDDADKVSGVENYLNDSDTSEVLLSYDSGKMMDRLRFSLNAYGNDTKESGSDILPEVDYSQAAVYTDLRYPLNRRISLTGTLGYDDINTNGSAYFVDSEISGAFWKAGLLLKPGHRTQIQVELGERYGGTWVESEGEYRLSSRLMVRSHISRTFQTRAQGISNSFSALQSQTLSYIDDLRQNTDLTANEIAGRAVTFNSNLTDLNRGRSGLAASDNATLSVIGRNARTQYTISGGYDKSDFGFQETESLFIGTRVERRLSRRTTVYGRLSARRAETTVSQSFLDCTLALSTDPAFAGLTQAEITAICQNPASFIDKATTIDAALGGRYRLGDNVSAFLQINRTDRNSQNNNLDYTQNAVTVGVTYDF